MANRALAIAGVALIAVGGAIAGYGATRPAPASTPVPNGGANTAMASAVAGLDGNIKAVRAVVQSIAKQLSTLQSVRAALSADKTTAEDNYKSGALKFELDPGEVIERSISPLNIPAFGICPIPRNIALTGRTDSSFVTVFRNRNPVTSFFSIPSTSSTAVLVRNLSLS